MYSGVGLPTPKGSGTSGHVQRNHAVLPRKEKQREEKAEPLIRTPDPSILEHNKKRQIEVECMELSDTLEDAGYTQQEIDREVNSFRKRRLDDYEKSGKCGDSTVQDSHQSAEAQHQRNAKLQESFGLSTSEPPSNQVSQVQEKSWD